MADSCRMRAIAGVDRENVDYFGNVEPSSSEKRERLMKRFIEGEDRSQSTLFPEHLDDYIAEDNPVRVIDVFVDELDLSALDFEGMQPEVTGRPGYTRPRC